ncbi:MAG: NIL domain-containing protein [Desulfococcaceae bacterium]|jgi:ferredoxin|nr:NIL domain-containing protein [Desulfococcaceae bacterium]
MYSKILVLRFSRDVAQKPLVCHLVREYDLTFNILNAEILPRKEGIMVLELYGEKKNFKKGVRYLKDQGVQVTNSQHEVRRMEDRCTHCGACTAVCPTAALYVKRPEMSIVFDKAKCSVCELCVPACPSRVMRVRPTSQLFFDS